MIFAECPECDAPVITHLDDAHIGQWERCTCEECGAAVYIQHTRLGGEVRTQAEMDALGAVKVD